MEWIVLGLNVGGALVCLMLFFSIWNSWERVGEKISMTFFLFLCTALLGGIVNYGLPVEHKPQYVPTSEIVFAQSSDVVVAAYGDLSRSFHDNYIYHNYNDTTRVRYKVTTGYSYMGTVTDRRLGAETSK